MLLGSCLNFIGALVRVFPYPFVSDASGSTGYTFAFIGQFILSVSQCFILATPSIIAQRWYPPSERVRATSIGALFNQVKICLGFFIFSLFVISKPSISSFF